MKLFYLLTAYLPRPLPKTKEEFEHMRQLMIKYYGLEDDPKVTYTLVSQLMTGAPFSLRRSYGMMANSAKKLRIAKLVHDLKEIAIEEETARLKALAEKTGPFSGEVDSGGDPAKRGVLEGAHDLQPGMQTVQSAQESMVSDPRQVGL